jgi:transcriptional regulator with XRE-family HTH domain
LIYLILMLDWDAVEGVPMVKESRSDVGDPNIAANLRRLLIAAGRQGKELADLIGVSPQAVSQWMTGQLMPSDKRLAQIATVLDVEVDDLKRSPMSVSAVPVKRLELVLSPEPPDGGRLVHVGHWVVPIDMLAYATGSSHESTAAIRVKDDNLEPAVWVGEDLLVDLSWQAITLSDLYLIDFGGFPLFRWCHLVTHETVNVSDRRMDRDFAANGLVVLGRVVGRVSRGPIRK